MRPFWVALLFFNEDDHVFNYSAVRKYGGQKMPSHTTIFHQYMRETQAGCGKMIIGADSHTRYGALGTIAIGEGAGGRVPQHATPEIKKAHTDSVTRSNQVMAKINKPLIAAVNGECSAGGMSILLNADIAVAVKDAKFGFSEALRGGFPAMILPQCCRSFRRKTCC